MKFFLLSDSTDALIGMRLAGVEGRRVNTPQAMEAALDQLLRDPEIGILLVTPQAEALCPQRMEALRREVKPLLVQIPDGEHSTETGSGITQYIRDAVGVKI